MKDTISVVVPVYNVEKYLEDCIQSILSQSYPTFELILIDDGSTDSSGKICDKLQEKDSRIRVIHQANGGLSSARNRGIEEAKGSYICFVDSDDMLLPRYLETLHRISIAYNADVSWCGYTCSEAPVERNGNTMVRGKRDLWNLLATVGPECKSTELVVAWNKLIRTELAKEIRFPEGKWHEDEFWVHRLLSISQRFVETTEKLYYYRKRQDSIVGSAQRQNIRHLDIIDALEERVHYAKQTEDNVLYRKMINAYRQTIIIQYHEFWKKGQAAKLKFRFWKSFFLYPADKRLLKSYAVFGIHAGLYYKIYWK